MEVIFFFFSWLTALQINHECLIFLKKRVGTVLSRQSNVSSAFINFFPHVSARLVERKLCFLSSVREDLRSSEIVNSRMRFCLLIFCNHLWCSCFPVEDQKEIPSPVNPELRHKEVQMNFFNQLTSVFNPDITGLASPSVHMQVSEWD